MTRVIFVCLGNICRSPMAEAVFQHLVDAAGLTGQFQVESRGTGAWHVGEPAHPGTQRVLAKRGIAYQGCAQHLEPHDLDDPQTYVVVMDSENWREVQRRFGDVPRLHRLLEFAGRTQERDVPDPFYTGAFEQVYALVEEGCRGLLAAIRAEEGVQRLGKADGNAMRSGL